MKKEYIIPVLYICFAVISITVLRSIAPYTVNYQILFFLLGGFIFFLTSYIPFSWIQKTSPLFYTTLIILLIIPLILGNVTRGSTRWIPIGPFHLQPSQLAVFVVALVAGNFIQKNNIDTWRNIFLFGIITIIPWLLIFIEPDLGTSFVYFLSIGSVLFFSSLSNKKIVTLLCMSIPFALVVWFGFVRGYQKERVSEFGTSYHSRQSLIAVGSGQFLGRGFGHGVQSQLRFLPERQTDFIFASLAEEGGFIVSSFVLLLYIVFLLTISYYFFREKNKAKKAFLVSTGTLFLLHITIHVGMNIGLLPITGLTLPFLSYGGSSIIAFCFSLGLIQRIILEYRRI